MDRVYSRSCSICPPMTRSRFCPSSPNHKRNQKSAIGERSYSPRIRAKLRHRQIERSRTFWARGPRSQRQYSRLSIRDTSLRRTTATLLPQTSPVYPNLSRLQHQRPYQYHLARTMPPSTSQTTSLLLLLSLPPPLPSLGKEKDYEWASATRHQT